MGRRRALLAAALCFSATGAASLYRASNSLLPIHDADLLNTELMSISDSLLESSSRRELSIALPHGGCQVTYAHKSEVDIAPTWQASFPGSGARMTWSLVEALTGIRTNDDYNSHERGYERVVAVKTHYPVKDARRRFKGLDELFGRAMVILRNPLSAIPSYFNLQYEHLHQLPNHSTRGPNEDWIMYRDNAEFGFSTQISNYEKFVEYWMDKYEDRSNLLMVSYEDLTDNWLGPIVSTRIAGFLAEVDGVDPIAPEAISCVWETIVNYKKTAPPPVADEGVYTEGNYQTVEAQAPPVGDLSNAAIRRRDRKLRRDQNKMKKERGRRLAERRRTLEVVEPEQPAEQTGVNGEKLFKGKTHADPSSLRVGPKVRPYTEQNLGEVLAMFQRLAKKYNYDEDFVRIMASYIETAANTAPVEDDVPS